MKAKYGVLIAGLAVAAAVWLLTRPVPLASMHHACSRPETSVSTASFSGQAGDQVKFSLSSNVKSGLLDVFLLDSQGNMVKRFGQAKQLVTFVTLSQTDTYTLRAEYDGFTGDFSAAIYRGD